MLVSRDTTALTEAQVRESAIETLAENLNDSVIAPIFWFVLLGLPGAAVYRFANTADAMWGYKGVSTKGETGNGQANGRRGRTMCCLGCLRASPQDCFGWCLARFGL